mgnify:CR=1 FL=1
MSTLELIFGTNDWRFLLAGFFYLNVGIFLASVVNTTGREPNSDRTPFRFSWRFFAKDNWKRWAKSVLFGVVAMRFCHELLNQQLTTYIALMIGFSIDGIIAILTRKKFI